MRFSSLFYATFTVVGILLVDHVHGQNAPAMATPQAMSEIQVPATAARTYWLRQAEIAELRGTYALSNGWIMKIRPEARKMLAEIDGRGTVELRALSPDKFVSVDGNMTMEFNLGDSHNDMVLAYRPDPRLAQVIVVRTSLAAR